jgi:hypothetical protein
MCWTALASAIVTYDADVSQGRAYNQIWHLQYAQVAKAASMPPLHDTSDAAASGLASVEHAAALEIATASDMRVRGTVLMAFRAAAVATWGEEGLREMGQLLSERTRRDTVDVAAVNLDWMPETYVLEWYNALWHGPCCKRRELFLKFLNRMIDAGFGRVRKTLVAFASPATVLNKASSLWQHDHSHGTLKLRALEPDSAKVSLIAHPYTETSLARLATAEIYRYCLALCRVRDVVEVHYREPNGTFIVCLRWTA